MAGGLEEDGGGAGEEGEEGEDADEDGDVDGTVGEAEAAQIAVTEAVDAAGAFTTGPHADGDGSKEVNEGAAHTPDQEAGYEVAWVMYAEVDA